MKKALVIGITGQDGAYLAALLLKKGYEVHGIKRRSSSFERGRIEEVFEGARSGPGRLRMHFGDLTDAASLHRILEAVAPDEIYNLGAQSHVAVSFELPTYTAQVNAFGALHLLEALRLLGVGRSCRFYQASTSELFGGMGDAPQNESSRFHPRSPYGCSKLFAHAATVNYREAFGFFACNGILFNHESPLRGETFVTRKITRAVAAIREGLEECVVLGNLDAERDWGHAREYVEGIWRILNHEIADDFVLATGRGTTVREFARLAFANADIPIEFEGKGTEEVGRCRQTGRIRMRVDPRHYRPSEVFVLRGDAGKAQRELGWQATIDVETLCREMVLADIYRLEGEHQRSGGPTASVESRVLGEGLVF